jgi:hypothetical protein
MSLNPVVLEFTSALKNHVAKTIKTKVGERIGSLAVQSKNFFGDNPSFLTRPFSADILDSMGMEDHASLVEEIFPNATTIAEMSGVLKSFSQMLRDKESRAVAKSYKEAKAELDSMPVRKHEILLNEAFSKMARAEQIKFMQLKIHELDYTVIYSTLKEYDGELFPYFQFVKVKVGETTEDFLVVFDKEGNVRNSMVLDLYRGNEWGNYPLRNEMRFVHKNLRVGETVIVKDRFLDYNIMTIKLYFYKWINTPWSSTTDRISISDKLYLPDHDARKGLWVTKVR